MANGEAQSGSTWEAHGGKAPHAPGSHSTLTPAQWGMISFLISEVAFFSTLIVVYLAFLRAEQTGPTQAVLSLPLVICTTICLLSSSATAHLAEKSLRSGSDAGFFALWTATILLGVVFLAGTAYEWHDLIVHHGLAISRNVFGTTYFTLIGFHALHVTIGVLVMSIILGLAFRNTPKEREASVELTSWYWHFVDAVWIVVFTVVYLVR